jgi:hypothetical protein
MQVELERQARFQLEYQFGSAMSDEQIAEEPEFLRHWEAERFSMTEHSRGPRTALRKWVRVRQCCEELQRSQGHRPGGRQVSRPLAEPVEHAPRKEAEQVAASHC